MLDVRVATFALSLALLGFAVIALRRQRSDDHDVRDLGGPRVLELEVHDSQGTQQVRAPGAILIGRSPSAAIRLADLTVSRLHARVERRDDNVYVEDLGSRNGTLLNGKPIAR